MRALRVAEILKRMGGRPLAIFLDYDGTLVPIRRTPEAARIFPGTRRLIRDLAGCPGVTLAIVSGRSLEEIRRFVGVRGILYVGNHGLEMEGPSFRFHIPGHRQICAAMKRRARLLRRALGKLRGVRVEDKGLTLSVHYREAAGPAAACAARAVTRIFQEDHQVRLRPGKKTWEIRPALDWNKGNAVRWLLNRGSRRALALYAGDDVTDEDAFRILHRRGVTVRVTKRPREASWASFYVDSPAGIRNFLEKIYRMKNEA